MDGTIDDKQRETEEIKQRAKKIGKELKTIMLQKDMKQIDVAEKYGTSKNAFNNLINQKLDKISDIVKISQILNCKVKLIFTDETGKDWECSFDE